jgi:arylsulfatase
MYVQCKENRRGGLMPMAARARNILIICTDQQRYDSLGCTGNRHAQTPHIDALAAEGTQFRRHITASPVCMPSRASFFSGRYPCATGVWTNGIEVPRRRGEDGEQAALGSHLTTLGEVFQGAGYHTRSIGKLHFTPYLAAGRLECPESWLRWKDEALAGWHGPYYGFEHVDLTVNHGEHHHHGGHYWHWLKQNFPEVVERLKHSKPASMPGIGDVHPGVIPVEAHHSTWIGNEACAFLSSEAAREKPFLLYLSFPDPHHPYTPPPELAREFEQREVLPWHRGGGSAGRPQAYRDGGDAPSEECVRRVRQYTDAMLHLIDRNVGRVVSELKRAGLWDETIVVYTSDHGDFLGDFGLLRKKFTGCRALNHVPFVLRAPGMSLPAESSAPMSNADVLPTLCQLAEVAAPAGVQGRSMLPVLRGEAAHVVPVYGYHSHARFHNFSVFDARYRFTIFPGTGERELYDHGEDPHELVNRAGDAGLANVERGLMDKLLNIHLINDAPSGGRVCDW